MKKVSFFWAYCYNNIGDDLFFYIILLMMKRQYGDTFKIDILSSNPQNTYWEIENVDYVNSLNIFQVIKSLYLSEYLVIWPGSIFTSVSTYWKQNVYVLGLSLIAKVMKKKVVFLWIDFVPIENILLKYMAIWSLFLSEKIYIRFEDNFQLLMKIPKLSTKLSLINDLVFSEFFTKNFFKLSNNHKIQKKIWIVFSDLSYFWNNSIVEQLYVNVIDILLRKNYNIDFLILNNWISQNKDLVYIDNFLSTNFFSLKEKFNIVYYKWNWTIKNISSAISDIYSYTFLISNKLHSSIISSIIWTSFFSFSYHEKMRSVNKVVWLQPEFNFDIDKINNANIKEYLARFEFSLGKLENECILNYNFTSVKKILKDNQIALESIKL